MQLLRITEVTVSGSHPSGSDFLEPSCRLAPKLHFHDGHKFTIHNTFYINVSVHFYILVPKSTQVNTLSILPLDAFLLNPYIKRSGNFFFSETFITYESKPSESESEVAQSCRLFATPWTVTYQAPRSMGFSRQ